MKPWIKNLSSVYKDLEAADNKEEVLKVREWFNDLTTVTITNKDTYSALLTEIWGEIAIDASLVSISIEAITKQMENLTVGTEKGDILSDLIVTLSSHKCKNF
jgi:hypothetical protein